MLVAIVAGLAALAVINLVRNGTHDRPPRPETPLEAHLREIERARTR